MEWTRFRKYARRMRELKRYNPPGSLSSETFPTIRINEPFLPNLKTVVLTGIQGWFVPFIPLFLSPRITSITLGFEPDLPEATIASTITTLSALCSNLQEITLYNLPRSPVITAAISGGPLITDRNTLQRFRADSALTEDASKVLYKLPNLCGLTVFIERETPLPPASLPNLIDLTITCDDEDNWPRLFQGAILGKLEDINFYLQSKRIGDFLGAFERAALSSPVQNTLSKIYIFAQHSWNPNYSSSIYAAGSSRDRNPLRWWMLLKGGRRYHHQPFAGNTKARIPCIRRSTMRPKHRRRYDKGIVGPVPSLPKTLFPLCTPSGG